GLAAFVVRVEEQCAVGVSACTVQLPLPRLGNRGRQLEEFRGGHGHAPSTSRRNVRIRLSVEESPVSGSALPASTGCSSVACDLPSSTPHWSNESIPQITPCTKT